MRKSLVIAATVAVLAWPGTASAIMDESNNSVVSKGKELDGTTVSLPPTVPAATESGKQTRRPPAVDTETSKRSHKATAHTAPSNPQDRSSNDTVERGLGTALGIGLGLGVRGGFGGFSRGGDRGSVHGGRGSE